MLVFDGDCAFCASCARLLERIGPEAEVVARQVADLLTYADGSTASGKATADTDIVEARFLDIVPEVRVVQAVDFVSDDHGKDHQVDLIDEVALDQLLHKPVAARHL